jgi:hypothetical protein
LNAQLKHDLQDLFLHTAASSSLPADQSSLLPLPLSSDSEFGIGILQEVSLPAWEMCGGSLQATHLTAKTFWCILRQLLSSAFTAQIGKGPNRKNLGKVLLVLQSTIGACYNLIHYDIEYIHLIAFMSIHRHIVSVILFTEM